MIEFRALGNLGLCRTSGQELHSLLAQPKRIALLAYLCLASPRGFHRRDTLASLLWPDSEETHARSSLRNALHVLRRALGDEALLSRGDEEIAANFDLIWCDGRAFEQALSENKVEEALKLYRGDLLPGFFIDEAAVFERWLDDERKRLRLSAAHAARILAERLEANGNPTEALEWARRAVELTDIDERAVRWQVELMARAGDRAGALHVYDEFAARLASDFEAEPSPETRTLAEQLRGGVSPTRQPTTARNSAASEVTSGVISIGHDTPPLSEIAGKGNASVPYRHWSRWVYARRGAIGLGALAVITVTGMVYRASSSGGVPPAERKKLTFAGVATQGSVSPDGQFLAYVAQAPAGQQLIVQDLTGGPPETIMTYDRSPVDNIVEWSPDGSRLLVRINRKVVLVHRRGGAQEVVPRFQPGDIGHWLPDGQRVSLYNSRRGRFVLVNLKDGSESTIHVAATPLLTFEGAWSPNGRTYAVVVDDPEAGRWLIRTIGSNGRTEDVVIDSLRINSPRWSEDGSIIYYLRGTDAIWKVNVSSRTGKATAAPEQVQSGVDALPGNIGLVHFSLSRNGRNLVYAKGELFSNIYRVNVTQNPDRPQLQPLTSGTALRWSPVVSPDGQWIAFAAETKDGSELYRMPITGGPAIPVTSGALVWWRSQIAWSPHGDEIAFQSARGGKSQIWIVVVASGELRRLERTMASRRTAHLAWAPASRIAYQIPRLQIRAVDPVTGSDELLIRDTLDAAFHYPTYSPKGEKLAMVRYHEPERSLVSIVRLSDGADRRLPTGLLFPRGWDATGRFVFAQVPFKTEMVRIDSQETLPTDTLFRAKALEMDCTPAGARYPQSFICAFVDFVSDIWMIKDFDRTAR
jgi:serine/threonine-protein kinase